MYATLSEALQAFSLSPDKKERLEAQRFIKSSAVGRFFPLNWLEDNTPQLGNALAPTETNGETEGAVVVRLEREEVHGYASTVSTQREQGQTFLNQQIPSVNASDLDKAIAMHWHELKRLVTEGLEQHTAKNYSGHLTLSLASHEELLANTSVQHSVLLKEQLKARLIPEETITQQNTTQRETSLLINSEIQQKLDLLHSHCPQTEQSENEASSIELSEEDVPCIAEANKHLETLYTHKTCLKMCHHFINSHTGLDQQKKRSILGFLSYTFAKNADGEYVDCERIITAIEECKNNYTAAPGESVSCTQGFIQRLEMLAFALAKTQEEEPREFSALLQIYHHVAQTYLCAQITLDSEGNSQLPEHLEHLLVIALAEKKSSTQVYAATSAQGHLTQEAREQSKPFCENLNDGISTYLETGDPEALRQLIPMLIEHMANIAHLMEINEEYARCVLWLAAHDPSSTPVAFLSSWGSLIARSVHYFESSDTVGTSKSLPAWLALEKKILETWRKDNEDASEKLFTILSEQLSEILITQTTALANTQNKVQLCMQDLYDCACIPHIPPAHHNDTRERWFPALKNLSLLKITQPSVNHLALCFGDREWEKFFQSPTRNPHNKSYAAIIHQVNPVHCDITWALVQQRYDIIEELTAANFLLYLHKLEKNPYLQAAITGNPTGVDTIIKRIITIIEQTNPEKQVEAAKMAYLIDLGVIGWEPDKQLQVASTALVIVHKFILKHQLTDSYQALLDNYQHFDLGNPLNPLHQKINRFQEIKKDCIQFRWGEKNLGTLGEFLILTEKSWHGRRRFFTQYDTPSWQKHWSSEQAKITEMLITPPWEGEGKTLLPLWHAEQEKAKNQASEMTIGRNQLALVQALYKEDLEASTFIIEHTSLYPEGTQPCMRTWGFFLNLANYRLGGQPETKLGTLKNRAEAQTLITTKLSNATVELLSGLDKDDVAISFRDLPSIIATYNLHELRKYLPEPLLYHKLKTMDLMSFIPTNTLIFHRKTFEEPIKALKLFHEKLQKLINQLINPYGGDKRSLEDIWFNEYSPLFGQAPKIIDSSSHHRFLLAHSHPFLEILLRRVTSTKTPDIASHYHNEKIGYNVPDSHHVLNTLFMRIEEYLAENPEYNSKMLNQTLTTTHENNPIIFAIQNDRYDMAELLFSALGEQEKLPNCELTTSIMEQVFTDQRDAAFWISEGCGKGVNYSHDAMAQHTPELTLSLCEKLLLHGPIETFITKNHKGKSLLERSIEIHGLSNKDYRPIWQLAITQLTIQDTIESTAALGALLSQIALTRDTDLDEMAIRIIHALPTDYLTKEDYGFNLVDTFIKNNQAHYLAHVAPKIPAEILRKENASGRTLLALANVRRHWLCALILQNFCEPGTPISASLTQQNPAAILEAYEMLAPQKLPLSQQGWSIAEKGQPLLHILTPILDPTIDCNEPSLLSAQNAEGDTLLHLAVRHQDWHTAKKIISQHNRLPTILHTQNAQGQYPLTLLLATDTPDLATGLQLIQALYANKMLCQQAPTKSEKPSTLERAITCVLNPIDTNVTTHNLFFGNHKYPSIPELIKWQRECTEPFQNTLKSMLHHFKLDKSNHRDFHLLLCECAEIGDIEGLGMLIDCYSNLYDSRDSQAQPNLFEQHILGFVSTTAPSRYGHDISPLILAAKNGHTTTVAMLIEKMKEVDINIIDKPFSDSTTPLEWAIKEGHTACALCIIQALDSKKENQLDALFHHVNTLCGKQEQHEEDKMLIEKILTTMPEVIALIGNTEPNISELSIFNQSSDQQTNQQEQKHALEQYLHEQPLTFVREYIDFSLRQQKNGVTKTLLTLVAKKGYDYLVQLFKNLNENGDTLLHLAVEYNHHQGLEILLEYCPKDHIMALNKDGQSSLHCSCQLEERTRCTQALLLYTSTKEWLQEDSNEKTPLELAVEQGNIPISVAMLEQIPQENLPIYKRGDDMIEKTLQHLLKKEDLSEQQHANYLHILKKHEEIIQNINAHRFNTDKPNWQQWFWGTNEGTRVKP